MIELVKQPWAWYVSGTFIGLTVPALLILENKPFGLSSSLRHICAACFPSNINYFKYNWRKEIWNLFFVLGILIGAMVASIFLKDPNPIVIAEKTRTVLEQNNVSDFEHLIPTDIFNLASILTVRGFIFIVLGGFLIGFGTRYAGGCTSGHAIMGLSNLQLPSLISTMSFMVGGIVFTWYVLPFILNL